MDSNTSEPGVPRVCTYNTIPWQLKYVNIGPALGRLGALRRLLLGCWVAPGKMDLLFGLHGARPGAQEPKRSPGALGSDEGLLLFWATFDESWATSGYSGLSSWATWLSRQIFPLNPLGFAISPKQQGLA